VTPFYQDDLVTIYSGDSLDYIGHVEGSVLVTDPPYGIDYHSGKAGKLARSIEGDTDTSLRDAWLEEWDGPALVFGTWRIPRPPKTRQVLIWDSMGALGMGALDLPWKPAHQEIYVIGKGFEGHRGTDVLRYPPVQSMARTGRTHPHEKPVPLMRDLIAKCPPGVIVDPFMGSGSTLRAAKDLGRHAIGIERNPQYVELAVSRLGQEPLWAGAEEPTLASVFRDSMDLGAVEMYDRLGDDEEPAA
jgi:DNA modification methylase